MSGRHAGPPLGCEAREATASPWHGRHRAPDLGGSGWAYRYGDDWRCFSCGAEVDHYLGCPDDPNPDYAAEAAALDWGSPGPDRCLSCGHPQDVDCGCLCCYDDHTEAPDG